MRIISGKARGTKLYTLEGENTRPTLDRVKESVFNIIQNEIQNCIFLDLFSGSGSIGIEAVSRGAKKAIMCDSSKEAISVIEKNIQKTHSEKYIELYCGKYDFVLKNRVKEKVDIVYVDPPYKTDFAYKSVELLLEKQLLKEQSIVIIETDQEEIIHNIQQLDIEIISQRKYGRAHIIFLKRK